MIPTFKSILILSHFSDLTMNAATFRGGEDLFTFSSAGASSSIRDDEASAPSLWRNHLASGG